MCLSFCFWHEEFTVELIFVEQLISAADKHLFAMTFFPFTLSFFYLSLIFLWLRTKGCVVESALLESSLFQKKKLKESLTLQVRTVLQYKPGLSSQRQEADREFRSSENTLLHDYLSCFLTLLEIKFNICGSNILQESFLGLNVSNWVIVEDPYSGAVFSPHHKPPAIPKRKL